MSPPAPDSAAEAPGIRIGPLRFSPPVFLAPMAGYTDLLFRTLVRRLGGLGLAYTEMISPHSLLRGGGRKREALLATSPEDTPLCYQLYGADAAIMAMGARWLAERGAAMIDLNMGCPKRKIIRNGSGAGLLADPDAAIRLARTVVEAVPIPVTVKVRLGLTSNILVERGLVRGLEEAGVAAVTIHGRTGEQGYTGKADWEAIRLAALEARRIPVIGNGDVTSPESALNLMERTGCRAVMVGREALKNPWVIRDIGRALSGAPALPPPSRRERAGLALEHLEETLRTYGDATGVIVFRKWIPQIARDMKLPRKEMVRWLCLRQAAPLQDALRRLAETEADADSIRP
jgi:nifR3 family TIM-barrel protein